MQNLSYENEFYLHVNEKLYFHMKGYAPRLALKKGHKTTRKWPTRLMPKVI